MRTRRSSTSSSATAAPSGARTPALAWRQGGVSAGWFSSYFGSFVDTSAATTEQIYRVLGYPDYIRKFNDNGITRYLLRVAPMISHNANVGYRFGTESHRWLRGVSARLALNNVFDRDPSLADETNAYVGGTANGGRRRHRRQRGRPRRRAARPAGRVGGAARFRLRHQQSVKPAAAWRAALPGPVRIRTRAGGQPGKEDPRAHRPAPGPPARICLPRLPGRGTATLAAPHRSQTLRPALQRPQFRAVTRAGTRRHPGTAAGTAPRTPARRRPVL
jgi:hypothetical protein